MSLPIYPQTVCHDTMCEYKVLHCLRGGSDMKTKRCRYPLCVLWVVLFSPINAHANSSWHWFTDNPLTALPWAVLGVLVVEVCLISFISHMKITIKSVIVICLANAFSFLLPYVFIGLSPAIYSETTEFFEVIQQYVNKFLHYTVGAAFLILTLVSEIPFVYFTLRRNVGNQRRFLVSILFSNTLTTIILAVVERLIFRGKW